MSERPTATTTEDSAAGAGDGPEQPLASAPAPERDSYRAARLVTLISAAVAVAGCKAVCELIEWMNRIGNARPEAEHYCPIFEQVMLSLGAALCCLCVLAWRGSYPPLRLAGKASIRVLVLSLLICIVPFWGPILIEILLYLPVALFGVVVVKAAIDSWFHRASTKSLSIAGPIAVIAGLTSLVLSMFVGKYFALAWTGM